jgi:hypothetical protein
MLTGPLSGIVMLLAGAPVSNAEASVAGSRRPVSAMTPVTRFELPRRAVPSLRMQMAVSRAPEFADLRDAPERDARVSVAGLAMGLGAAAIDHDRFDMRALRLDRIRGGRMSGPLDAGLRLKLTGDRRTMKADVGLTGAVGSILGSALRN